MAMPRLDEQIQSYRKAMKEKLSPERYEHSLSVSYMCISLAMTYGYNLKKAETAGILHDCAKHFTDQELIEKCARHDIPLTRDELSSPAVIHAKYGAWLAENKYGIEDEDILSAIACHTTGKPDMGLLDKILYVADYIEPRRNKASDLPHIRELAFHDIDAAVYEISRGTLKYLKESESPVDPETEDVYEYYKKVFEAAKQNKRPKKDKNWKHGTGKKHRSRNK